MQMQTIGFLAALGVLSVFLLSWQDSQEAAKPPANEAFLELQEQLESLAPKTREDFEENFAQYIEQAKKLYGEFAKNYPATEEGFEAQFQLAMIALQMEQDISTGIKILEQCIAQAGNNANWQSIKAKASMMIATTYKNSENFSAARQWYEKIQKDFANSPFAEFAGQELEELVVAEKLAIGKMPIDFEVTGLNGEKLSPKKFLGKVVLLDFWATWCGPCKLELPYVKESYELFKEQGFAILGISLDRSRATLQTYLQENNITWPQYFDGQVWENQIAQLYAVRGIPFTLLLDKKGAIRYRNVPASQLKEKIQELLNAQ